MQIVATALSLAFMASGVPAHPMVKDAPLAQLCERICGSWEEADARRHPDAIHTTYQFGYDAAAGIIRGELTSTGGVAGRVLTYHLAYGQSGEAMWSLSMGGTTPPVYGSLSLTARGFQTRMSPIGNDAEYMITTFTFDGPDRFTKGMEISSPRGFVRGEDVRFKRSQTGKQ